MPYLIEQRVALVVTLNDPVGTYDSVIFSTRIEGCSFDSIYLSSSVTEHEYHIYNPAEMYLNVVKIEQDYSLCPLRCDIIPVSDSFMPPYIWSDLEETVDVNPSFVLKEYVTRVSTTLAPLSGSYFDVRIACESSNASTDRKMNGIAYKTSELRIYFEDQCQFVNIIPSTREDIVVPLYRLNHIDLIQPSANVTNCAPIKNYVQIKSSTAQNGAKFTENIGPLASGSIGSKLKVEPSNKSNIGEYLIQMKSCIAYGDGSMEKCQVGTPFVVTIVDPCYKTTIETEIFVDEMSKPQLQTQKLNLRD